VRERVDFPGAGFSRHRLQVGGGELIGPTLTGISWPVHVLQRTASVEVIEPELNGEHRAKSRETFEP
jgi:hypothetical protein